MKKWLLWSGRLLIAGAAMYFAIRHIQPRDLQLLVRNANWWWLLPAFILYNLSQLLSSWRLLRQYRLFMPDMDFGFNLILYYKGMFYNLFLPGGIGGDIYKVFALKKTGVGYRQLATATILDRVNGFWLLMALIIVGSHLFPIPQHLATLRWILSASWLLGWPLYWYLLARFFRPFQRMAPSAMLISFGVQLLQMACFTCILYFLQVMQGTFVHYSFLFFSSSVISAVPISIGGLGTRELVFSSGATWFNLSATSLVSVSLVFFLVTAISALAGWIVAGRTEINK